MSNRLDGRHALVSGATSDIGLAIVGSLLSAGATVHALGRRLERLDTLQHERLHAHAIDLVDEGAVASLASTGSIDILVLNAAHPSERKPLLTGGVSLVRAVMEVNFFAGVTLLQAVLGGMVDRRWGRIVHISSLAAAIGQAQAPGYCASKAALDALCRNVAIDYSAFGVTANSIEVGPVNTERLQAHGPIKLRRLAFSTAVRRLGNPEEVAHAVSYLVGEHAGFITGESLRVDGGIHLANPMSTMYVKEGSES
jgi:NAD(P)-dependent dehydrogenase (short-subunit alcohol dehydrogenase family)